MKRVLIIDGGGAKGIIPATVLAIIEEHTDKKIHEIFDLIVGTSAGALIGGMLSTGKVSARKYQEDTIKTTPKIFKKRLRIPIFQPKYSRKPLIDCLKKHISDDFQMKACVTKFMSTSVNMVSGRTHYFKSWEEKDGNLSLIRVLNRSYAAPLYFGSIVDKENKAVWLDGGTGINNSPQVEAYIEILRQEWLDHEPVHVLSIGCGQSDMIIPFKEAARAKNLKQVYYYANPVNGGLARKQSVSTMTKWLEEISNTSEDFSYQRLEVYNMSKDLDIMDGAKYIYCYEKMGEEIAKHVDYINLV